MARYKFKAVSIATMSMDDGSKKACTKVRFKSTGARITRANGTALPIRSSNPAKIKVTFISGKKYVVEARASIKGRMFAGGSPVMNIKNPFSPKVSTAKPSSQVTR